MRKMFLAVVSASVAGLTACGGGGGGGGSSSTLAPFVSWDRLNQPGQRFEVVGQALEIAVTLNPVTEEVISFSEPSASSATLFGTWDSRGETLESGGFSTSSGQRLSFTANEFDYSEDDDVLSITAENTTGTQNLGVIISGNYQSFGLWANQASSSSLTVGFYSVGATTSGSAVPTSGNANYSGFAGGLYSARSGEEPSEFGSTIGASANFNSRSMSFTSTTSEGSAPNFSGTLNWSAGSNSFSGNVASTGSVLTGSLTGSFYGPAAEEIGGTFALGGAGGAGLVGAFGARQR
jgi:hypothetical protein